MKSLIKTAIFAGWALASVVNACVVPNATTPDVRQMVEDKGGFPISDAKCAYLNNNKLLLVVSSQNGVLSGVAFGWAVVALKNKDGLHSFATNRSTYINTADPSTPKSEEMAYSAIRDAITGLDFEKAGNEVMAAARTAKGKAK